MSSSEPDPGSKSESTTTNGVLSPRPLPLTCGPACTVAPLYVLLNLESPHPEAALKELRSVIAEHSGHTTVYLVLDAPSATNERLFFEFQGFWRSGHLRSSLPGPAEIALEERAKPIAEHWLKYDGDGNLRHDPFGEHTTVPPFPD